jgi:hypothetical protein
MTVRLRPSTNPSLVSSGITTPRNCSIEDADDEISTMRRLLSCICACSAEGSKPIVRDARDPSIVNYRQAGGFWTKLGRNRLA